MARGTLRIYMGAAPGVGTTFAMLAEGQRRARRGTRVVIGMADIRDRPRTADLLAGLERVAPRHLCASDGASVDALDVERILSRMPAVVLVDDLAARGASTGVTAGRWEDVEPLLASGADVIATIRISQIESLGDVVARITGEVETQTVPDSFVRAADQIELVDMTPEALRRRLAHGNIVAPEHVDATIQRLYRPGTLSALRELALLWVADRVEEPLLRYMDAHDISGWWETGERVIVAMTGAVGNDTVIRRAARIARRAHGELVGVHVTARGGLAEVTDSGLSDHRQLLIRLGGRYHEVVGDDVGSSLVAFAHAERATQLVIGASRRSRWDEVRRGSIVSQIARELRDADMHVIAAPGPPQPRPVVARGGRRVSRARSRSGWIIALIGLPLLTLVGVTARNQAGQSGPLLAYLLLVAVVAAIGGALPGTATALVASLLANWYFTPPLHRLAVEKTEDLVALVVFVSVAALIAGLVGVIARRTGEAERARAESEALARTTGALVGEQEPLPTLLAQLRSTFALDAAAILVRDDRGGGTTWRLEGAVGTPVPASPDDGESIAIDPTTSLVLVGATLGADDRRLLSAFAAQLGAALAGRALQAEAAQATLLTQANNLRDAMLQSVSHDLRTPLASIKASVTSMLQSDVSFSPDEQLDLLVTIDEESDRLNRVVANLLDMSRLQANTLEPLHVATEIDDIVAGALASVAAPADRVIVDVDALLPAVWADPGLLERALANLVANALVWSPPHEPVRVRATAHGGHVAILIADRGPGIPRDQLARVFEPFQRLGDRSSQAGVGLGLAVARGFVRAMGGELELDDTPGGGLSAIVLLPVVQP